MQPNRVFSTSLPGGGRLEVIGESPVMQALFRELRTVACSDSPVLIEGETGVGKNLVARSLHHLGPRARKPFVALRAANLTDPLFEGELFGQVRSAFVGSRGHQGRAQAADSGTLLIDEVGELSLGAQAKLLCFLDRREIRPVGGLRPLRVDVRVICITNRDLREAVKTGALRRDLYYRLRVIAVQVPALRERGGDIELLARYFIERFNRRYGKSVTGIGGSALATLEAHAFEGNVRELENEIERAVVLTPDGAEIQAEILSIEPEVRAIPDPARSGESVLRASRHAAERKVIEKSLRRHRWNVSAASRELGISRVGLTRKLKRLGMRRPGTEAAPTG